MIIKVLANGDFGKVYLARYLYNDHFYAIKVIKRKQIQVLHTSLKNVLTERHILSNCESKFIIKLFTSFQDSKHFYFVLEYVSAGNQRKDYVDNMTRYGRDLQVPYYMLFEPQKLRLTLYKLGTKTRKFRELRPNAAGRLAIPELDIEMALVDVWVRFWFRGKLLPLPGEMAVELDESKKETRKAHRDTRVAEEAARAAEETAQREREAREIAESEVTKLRAELAAIRKGH